MEVIAILFQKQSFLNVVIHVQHGCSFPLVKVAGIQACESQVEDWRCSAESKWFREGPQVLETWKDWQSCVTWMPMTDLFRTKAGLVL